MSQSKGRKRPDDRTPVRATGRAAWAFLLGVGLACLATGVVIGRGSMRSMPAGSPASPAPAVAHPPPDRLVASFEDPRVRTFLGTRGPWGRLRYTRMVIEPPREFFRGHVRFDSDSRWFFPGMSPADIEAFLETVPLSAEQRRTISKAPREPADDGIWVDPPEELVLALEPAARARIYALLARSVRNAQRSPIAVRVPLLEERIAKSGLAPEITGLFRRLLYGEGRWRFFSDLPLLAARLPDPEDQERLAGMLSASQTFLVSLRIDEDSDVDTLVDYWRVGPRSRDVEPIITSLSRYPGGYELDISHFLPPFARRRLFTFEEMGLEEDPGHDCYWSAINFFHEIPDARVFEAGSFKEELERAYVAVAEEDLRLGDVVAYFDDRDLPVHASSFIADRIVFTKNGRNALHPFMFMRMDSLFELYQTTFAGISALTVKAFRLREDL